MPRGKKKSHKGGHRHFTSADDLKHEAEKAQKEREWRQRKGLDDSDEDEEKKEGAVARLSEEDSEEDEEDDDDESRPKGITHLIEVENPNRVKAKAKKVSQLTTEDDKPALSRREREELEKQQAKERYMKMHVQGKTDEAQADLARLAIIRKQREEAAKKREEERKAQDAEKKAAEDKLRERKQQATAKH